MYLISTRLLVVFFFFFKQKTAYEMRISDWSSDVCSSDLAPLAVILRFARHRATGKTQRRRDELTIGPIEQEVDRAQIGAPFRIAERLPLEEILARDRQAVGQLRLQRHIGERPEQLLGLGARSREALLQIDRCLCIGDAVDDAAEQQ